MFKQTRTKSGLGRQILEFWKPIRTVGAWNAIVLADRASNLGKQYRILFKYHWEHAAALANGKTGVFQKAKIEFTQKFIGKLLQRNLNISYVIAGRIIDVEKPELERGSAEWEKEALNLARYIANDSFESEEFRNTRDKVLGPENIGLKNYEITFRARPMPYEKAVDIVEGAAVTAEKAEGMDSDGFILKPTVLALGRTKNALMDYVGTSIGIAAALITKTPELSWQYGLRAALYVFVARLCTALAMDVFNAVAAPKRIYRAAVSRLAQNKEYPGNN